MWGGAGVLLECFSVTVHTGDGNKTNNQHTHLTTLPPNKTKPNHKRPNAKFAAGFVARPVGAVIFGHVGDRVGRRLSLLLSITSMALPTVLIGCLPTFSTAGIAAPTILAVLRIVQGLAMGGEYGTSIVYVMEMARPGKEGRSGSHMVAFCQAGLILGDVAVMAVVAACTPQQLDVWGWRIPFLLAALTGGVALFLRSHMPEPLELLARARLASSGGDIGGGAGGGAPVTATATATSAASTASATARGAVRSSPASKELAAAALAAKLRHRVPIAALLRRHLPAVALHTLVAAYAQTSVYTVSSWLPKHLREEGGVANLVTQLMFLTALFCKLGGVLATGWAEDRGLPLCWAGVANSVVGVALNFALAAVLRSNLPPTAADGSRSGAGFIAGVWVLQCALLAWTGSALSLLPPVGVNIYPTDVRASGYNLSYSLASGLLGGLTPLAVTAINASSRSGIVRDFAPAWWQLAAGGVSAAAYAVTRYAFPACNSAKMPPLLWTD